MLPHLTHQRYAHRRLWTCDPTAGGSEKCGKPIFADKSDADYQKILATFAPVTAMLKARPRIDMPGGQPAADVCRTCQ